MLRALNLLALEVAAVLQSEAGAEEIAADELLPLFVFVLVRARVPSLYSQSRFVSDFLPKHYALGRHGYSLATLQAALPTADAPILQKAEGSAGLRAFRAAQQGR